MREMIATRVTTTKISKYATNVVIIANLKDFFLNSCPLTQTRSIPTSKPETTPIIILVISPAFGKNSVEGPREYGDCIKA